MPEQRECVRCGWVGRTNLRPLNPTAPVVDFVCRHREACTRRHDANERRAALPPRRSPPGQRRSKARTAAEEAATLRDLLTANGFDMTVTSSTQLSYRTDDGHFLIRVSKTHTPKSSDRPAGEPR